MPLTVRPVLAAAAVAAVAVLALAACGSGRTIVVSGTDGGVASIGPSGQVSVSSSEGSVVIGGKTLPAGWPSEVGQPAGFSVVTSASTTTSAGKQAYTASFTADGNQLDAVNSWVESLKAAGFTSKTGIGGTTASGGLATLSNADWNVSVISVYKDQTGLIVNVSPAAG